MPTIYDSVKDDKHTIEQNLTRMLHATDNGKELKCVAEHPGLSPINNVDMKVITVKCLYIYIICELALNIYIIIINILIMNCMVITVKIYTAAAVSYTHLDVYKRQGHSPSINHPLWPLNILAIFFRQLFFKLSIFASSFFHSPSCS